MEPPFNKYITRHPSALSLLNSLPRTPVLVAYLSDSKVLAKSLTHAWDLPSLLVKPVQRLQSYPLLLSAIIAETPDSHPDKESMKQAKDQMERIIRDVNEQTRRREVVQGSLKPTPEEPKGRGRASNVPASVYIERIKKLPIGREKEEVEQVARMEQVLKRAGHLIKRMADEAIQWALKVKETTDLLRIWAIKFARVTGVPVDQTSEAFHAFFSVVEHLSPLGDNVESIIRVELQDRLARLEQSMCGPLRLLETMNSLEPLHQGLLNIDFTKYCPPPEYVEASQSYLVLRGELVSELPRYLTLLDKGIASSILQLAQWQTSYWADVCDRWSALWDALHVDGEINSGTDETGSVWRGRWVDTAGSADRLKIVKPGTQVVLNSANTHSGTVLLPTSSSHPTSVSGHSESRTFSTWRRRLNRHTLPKISCESKAPAFLMLIDLSEPHAYASMLDPTFVHPPALAGAVNMQSPSLVDIETSLSFGSSGVVTMAYCTSRPSQETEFDRSISLSSSPEEHSVQRRSSLRFS